MLEAMLLHPCNLM